MAVTLDELAGMPGVVLAFEFRADGTCTAHRKASPEMAAMAARYCATVTMQFSTLAAAFTALSERDWVPQQGWVYQGGAYTVVIGRGGFQGVFVETAEADLARLTQILFQDRSETKPADLRGRRESSL